MAEPLLKRTFSRLRGKERSRRKTDPKLSEAAGKMDLVQSSSSSSVPSTCAIADTDPHTVEDFTRRTQITVSKKQNWAKMASTSRDPASTDLYHDLAYRSQDWEVCSGKAQASKQAWSQRTLSEDGLQSRCNDLEWELGYSRTYVDTHGLPELTPPSAGYNEVCVTSGSAKISGQGAYLQTLERSSRAWVLSTGKPQAAEEASRLLPTCITEWRQGTDGESNIWYNPIPEEEDVRGENVKDFGDPWRRRNVEESQEERKDSQGKTQRWAGMIGTSSTSRGVSRELVGGAGGNSSASSSSGGGSSDSPGALKKGSGGAGGGSSVMDKIKSPGTVRRLSLKMRKLPELRRKLSLRSSRNHRQGQAGQGNAGGTDEPSPPNARKEASNNVISKYHLDSSAPARPRRRSSRSRSASKGGYLSDGDSPELLPKQGSPAPLPGQDSGSFRLYSLADQPRCGQRVSGLLTVHLLGVEELLRSARGTDGGGKEVFCAIQVDGVTRARTGLLTCRGSSLPLNHTFNLELERARLLKLVVLTPSATSNITAATSSSSASSADGSSGPVPVAPSRNRVCCLGAVAIPPLFRGSRCQQLCVKLEPRGLLYVKLTLLEQWEAPSPRLSELPPPSVFGVELRHLVEKEDSAHRVPLIIQKCVAEIEKRGLKVVGLYRLCGSAAVKKELRDAFERDSAEVTLSEELYPDINVITGILKDYLRELPSPLITRTLYEVVLEAMSRRPACRNDSDAQRSQSTVALLQCLPEPERATLSLLLDHLSLVASFSDSNRMTCQNLAVCFGPVLLTPTQESWRPATSGTGGGTGLGASAGAGVSRGGRSFAHSEEIASAVDFKRHIEALHYLLQLWPIPTGRSPDDSVQSPSASEPPCHSTDSHPPSHHAPPQRRCQRVPLRVDVPQDVVVSRRCRGRLESPPCNRYAGDWSVCGRDFLSTDDADYDEVAGSDSEEDEEDEEERQEPLKKDDWTSSGGLYVDDFALDFDAPFTCRLSLKDFDTLISDLERELAKQINICL
ncbi:rho GTPase-activating protein SYDE1 [Chanos chanos]|uniref:Rho GTPase-activating protein SYDE1 n=1 Tax=Chanos chanos TaxID=29144 RepID=A0A6J2VHY3_CHACN|nr:rho GTPase-activating protein SYDE1 [Chanos chanos]